MNTTQTAFLPLDKEYSLLLIYARASSQASVPQLNIEVVHGFAVINSGANLVHRLPKKLRCHEQVKEALKWVGWSKQGSPASLAVASGTTPAATPAEAGKQRLRREQELAQVPAFQAYLETRGIVL